MPEVGKQLRLGLLCGGPSPERGISLNSARSVMDHVGQDITVFPFYIDQQTRFYPLNPAQLYSNTPSDFDFKLTGTVPALTQAEKRDHLQRLDLVFPVVHGPWGEDGQLQSVLAAMAIPYVGSDARTCQRMFNKQQAKQYLQRMGYPFLTSIQVHQSQWGQASAQCKEAVKKNIDQLWRTTRASRLVLKPVAGGSSIGVTVANSVQEAQEKLHAFFSLGVGHTALIEPFCSGREFTVVVLASPHGEPVALLPSEIVLDPTQGVLFDYRRKYLPTNTVSWYCPARFAPDVIAQIRTQAMQLFSAFGMRDFARLDGWVTEEGQILFTDFNPISGMEQNSFIFQQSARIGFTHHTTLRYIINSACRRYGLPCLPLSASASGSTSVTKSTATKKTVRVVFGGNTAERQVSLMSGTNVWLKLQQSDRYHAVPYFVSPEGQLWQLDYSHCLNHTVEDVLRHCLQTPHIATDLAQYRRMIRKKLGLPIDAAQKSETSLRCYPHRTAFLKDTAQQGECVFLALHGGEGENGHWQAALAHDGIPYNGSGPQAAALCMDKQASAQRVCALGLPLVSALPKKIWLPQAWSCQPRTAWDTYWADLQRHLGAPPFIIKPQTDGCSAGIVRLACLSDLMRYGAIIEKKQTVIAPHTFPEQSEAVDMPMQAWAQHFIIESYIQTDKLCVEGGQCVHRVVAGWLELTIGFVFLGGQCHVLLPSITLAESGILSVAEKFQGGTGVNITPPPAAVMTADQVARLRQSIQCVVQGLGLAGYGRIDLFFNCRDNKVIIIEINALPALTPSTVLYHQAWADTPPLPPLRLLECILQAAEEKAACVLV